MKLHPSEIWFVTGSQHLYGPETLRQVSANALEVCRGIEAAGPLPIPLVAKPILTTPDEIRKLCIEASASPECAGVVLWMHTFSPAKMWIGGLSALTKPIAHLHTQFNKELPWETIDMDFMNLNQSAHGDREAGFSHTRLRKARKVIVGHWTDPETLEQLGSWVRVARAWHDLQGAKFARFGDNMREVSVTEGDKVAAEARFGFSVNGYGLGDLAKHVQSVSDAQVDNLIKIYEDSYVVADNLTASGEKREALRVAAQHEIGITQFLEDGGFKGFTTTFEDLAGLRQLPGLACQRLMEKGYGFGAEGDWKTAALLRAMKVIGDGLPGGTSFMEDYTYHLADSGHQVLGAHMLEICPTISAEKPRLEVHPLGIGGKEDPVRLVFNSQKGPALNASLIDLGNRFRLIVNEVTAVDHPDLPNLPVARAVWECKPDFKTAAAAWIYAGGAHHTGYSYSVTSEHMTDFAEIAGIEIVTIDAKTQLQEFRKELKWNEIYWHLAPGIRGS